MKYIIFGIILFLLITYIPANQIKSLDQIIIYMVALTSFVMIDIILNYQNIRTYCGRFINRRNTTQPGCGCTAMEKFTPDTPVTPVTQSTYTISPELTIQKPDSKPDFSQPLSQPILSQPTPSQITIPSTVPSPNTSNEAETSNQMKYTELPPEMHQPLGTYDNTFTNDFDHGYTLLNTDKWSVPMRRPPVCIQEKECPVCPSMTSGSLMNVKDFPMEIKMPEKINMEYVQDKINKMRV